MGKEIILNEKAKEKLKSGIDKLSNAVKVTLGPKGKNVIIDSLDMPQVTKDGVTVAKAIFLDDATENVGAQLVKNVAAKTNEKIGDGTTTSVILTQAIVSIGLKNIIAGAVPTDIKNGISKATKEVIKLLDKQSKIISKDTNEIKEIASISSNGDNEIASLISKAIKDLGDNSNIIIKESNNSETSLEVVQGIRYEPGIFNSSFISDTVNHKTVLKDPYILFTNSKISDTEQILHLLEKTLGEGHSLLIIADDFIGNALNDLIINKVRNKLNIAITKAPAFSDRREAMLEDMAMITGGRAILEKNKENFNELDENILGQAKEVILTKANTTIIKGKGDKSKIKKRITVVKKELEKAKDPYTISKLKERLSILTGGMAIIEVGGITEIEMKETKDRVEDAVNAVNAAIDEGIVIGGGTALLKCSFNLKIKGKNKDENIGIDIVKEAIQVPFKQILINAGLEPMYYVNRLFEMYRNPNTKVTLNKGFDVSEDKLVDMFEKGIIDPVKVTKTALLNASSIASLFLTTECVITENL
jgi:chaperonin GroEL